MNTYYFEGYSGDSYDRKKKKGYIMSKDIWEAKTDLIRRKNIVYIKVELSDHNADKDYEEIIELTNPQKCAKLVSNCIIGVKAYFKSVKEDW